MNARLSAPDLANPRAERVKRVHALAGRLARQRHQQFLVEGPQGVREALRWAPDRVVEVFLTPASAERHSELPTLARQGGVRLRLATEAVLAAMSGDAQGALAVVRTAAAVPVNRESLLSEAPRLVLVLSEVRDPGNAGTVIRTADAAGASLVVLAGDCVDPHNPKVVRATAGSLFHLPVVATPDLAEAVALLRTGGLRVLAADGAGETSLFQLGGLESPTAWVFGNEARGLSSAQAGLADARVRIPILGGAESLNLAAAAAVCLYASVRAQASTPADPSTHSAKPQAASRSTTEIADAGRG